MGCSLMMSMTSLERDICDYKIRSHYRCCPEQWFLNRGTGNSRTPWEDSMESPAIRELIEFHSYFTPVKLPQWGECVRMCALITCTHFTCFTVKFTNQLVVQSEFPFHCQLHRVYTCRMKLKERMTCYSELLQKWQKRCERFYFYHEDTILCFYTCFIF